jgi:3-deoxy-D-manno-octulosonate 8-phosphate phosphatase (KDO 8-P phosphatase)
MNLEEHALRARLERIRLVVMDVDGTMTDGSMYYSKDGEEYKRFYVRDGLGITMLHKAGIKTAIMTAENTPIIEQRAKRLQIPIVIQGCKEKKQAFEKLAKQENLSFDEIAYIGDDVLDEAPLRIAGVSCCPCDAHPIILEIVNLILPSPGGRGAIRDLCDHILMAKNLPLS